ncbi:glycosyltransferase family 32 protein [Acinetobacter kanungonis]|uniref:glycosyltransferase family 32 protein n=1 Tax=Acinetobacter kanungonis TaxID=2699469 RepID=UPI00137A4C11|nr:glycosyltransferase [Acinetobacter kanungonis]NCI79690.1 polysaccharide biosynthesis protein [Acinetobacter kanungonis]
MIPKIVHFCWFGGKEYPPLIKECMETWHVYLTDWEFKLWNEENSPMDHPMVKKAMDEKKYAFVADYVRIFALYTEGGIYLDTDIEVVKDFEPLLYNKFFAAYEDIEKNAPNSAVLGSVKKHSILRAMLEYYDNSTYFMTIPFVLATVLKNNNFNKDEYIIFDREYFYPYHIIESYPINQLMFKHITSNTYAIHHWKKSWTLEKENILIRVYRYILRRFGKY